MIKGLAVALLNLFEQILHRTRLWRIVQDEKITIARSTYISHTALLDAGRGGSITIGEETQIHHGVVVQTYGGKIIIGNRCNISPYCVVYGHGGVIIGDDVLMAAGCMIIPANHRYSDTTKTINSQGLSSHGITIESDVWIGHGCSILDGTTIGRGSVIAAGSVVNKNIPPMSVAGGVPAKILKGRSE